MKKVLLLVTTILFLSSCSNWTYKDVTNLRCGKLKEVHVHLYQHDSCEWHCLNLEEGEYTIEDKFRIKYKTDKKGKVKKVKLVK